MSSHDLGQAAKSQGFLETGPVTFSHKALKKISFSFQTNGLQKLKSALTPSSLEWRYDKSQDNQWLPWSCVASHRYQGLHITKAMTKIKSNLLRTLAIRSAGNQHAANNDGFTLVELLIVVVIVGILSAVALPQFFSQTKKAAATEGTQQASAIAKQAAAYYLEQGTLGTVDGDCSDYAGTIKDDNTNFTYACSGTKTAFVVKAKGIDGNDNTKGVEVTVTANLTDGTFKKPTVSGI